MPVAEGSARSFRLPAISSIFAMGVVFLSLRLRPAAIPKIFQLKREVRHAAEN
jgi:hypothetical protein